MKTAAATMRYQTDAARNTVLSKCALLPVQCTSAREAIADLYSRFSTPFSILFLLPCQGRPLPGLATSRWRHVSRTQAPMRYPRRLAAVGATDQRCERTERHCRQARADKRPEKGMDQSTSQREEEGAMWQPERTRASDKESAACAYIKGASKGASATPSQPGHNATVAGSGRKAKPVADANATSCQHCSKLHCRRRRCRCRYLPAAATVAAVAGVDQSSVERNCVSIAVRTIDSAPLHSDRGHGGVGSGQTGANIQCRFRCCLRRRQCRCSAA